ncbi:MAG: hypothetical protein ACOYU3_00675 [Bacillota bacterium]
MNEKIKVEVFGIRDQAASSGCGGGCCDCGSDCGPQATMGEMFEQLQDFIEASDMKDRVELAFIDVINDDMDGYADVNMAMERGFMIPLTAIDGKLRFHRGISNEMIYEAITESQTD